MSLSTIACASRACQVRTRAAVAARQQGIGDTAPVMVTAPEVLAQAAVTATHPAGLAHSLVPGDGDLKEGAGESEYVSGSPSKRKRHAVQPCKDASTRKTRSTLAGDLLSPSLQQPYYATANSPTHVGSHCPLTADKGSAQSDPQTGLQALDHILHYMQQAPISALGPSGGLRSKASRLASKAINLESSGLDENHSHSHNLHPPGLASSIAAIAASGALTTTKPQPAAQSAFLDDVEMDYALRYQGYMASAGSNPELFVFLTRTGVHMVSLLGCLMGIGHDKVSGAQALSNFRQDGDYAVGGVLAGRLCKACHMIGKGDTVVFAPVDMAVGFMDDYWSKTDPATKLQLTAGKEKFMVDLKAFIPRKRFDKVADRENIPGTSELGSGACRAYSRDIEAPDHGEMSEDISSFRLHPVPMSSLKDSPEQKRRDLNITIVNVLECLSSDFTPANFSKFQSKVRLGAQGMSEEQVCNFMVTNHVFLSGSYYHGNRLMMRDILDDIVLGIF